MSDGRFFVGDTVKQISESSPTGRITYRGTVTSTGEAIYAIRWDPNPTTQSAAHHKTAVARNDVDNGLSLRWLESTLEPVTIQGNQSCTKNGKVCG